MKLHNLQPAKGSIQKKKRLGKGEASGKGGTSTKGNKGAQSHASWKIKIGFEGGQMPIQRRTPKRGFKNPNHIEYKVFNLSQIESLVEKYGIKEFTLDNLYANALISRTDKVKILANGEIASAVTFKVHAASEKAKAAVEAAGGSIEIIK
ncbi:50S ribosomal protein L15 [Rhizosphaericola mali]|jgi:large subunit ribosomal protein L15|uniref:Large ribosomal subunit protein uL15 n=1 Tax=Rhizosphaericola mali TaxID=2545455 RepID=A0A5P2G3Z5_9BACT|nr:50S ribosomal protein L15 [Rhizosphaericola mali]QES90556.1 50S ribosomal protein L15 [Rhizosphaericola mali]